MCSIESLPGLYIQVSRRILWLSKNDLEEERKFWANKWVIREALFRQALQYISDNRGLGQSMIGMLVPGMMKNSHYVYQVKVVPMKRICASWINSLLECSICTQLYLRLVLILTYKSSISIYCRFSTSSNKLQIKFTTNCTSSSTIILPKKMLHPKRFDTTILNSKGKWH